MKLVTLGSLDTGTKSYTVKIYISKSFLNQKLSDKRKYLVKDRHTQCYNNVNYMDKLNCAHVDVNVYTYCDGKHQETEFVYSQQYMAHEMCTGTCCCPRAGSLTQTKIRDAKEQTQQENSRCLILLSQLLPSHEPFCHACSGHRIVTSALAQYSNRSNYCL
jgi:hypothetical protein